jgi:hypothetical protein
LMPHTKKRALQRIWQWKFAPQTSLRELHDIHMIEKQVLKKSGVIIINHLNLNFIVQKIKKI